jgi:hypothetical protein
LIGSFFLSLIFLLGTPERENRATIAGFVLLSGGYLSQLTPSRSALSCDDSVVMKKAG